MPRIVIYTLFIVLVASGISGCIGLGHVQVNVPPLIVYGVIKNNGNAIYIVVPEFYGASGAFVSLVKEEFSNDSLYKWRKINLPNKAKFNVNFAEENRYIGSMFPFSPSKKTMESRMLFLWEEGNENVYKVTVHGMEASVEKVNIKILKNTMPESLRGGTKEQWGGTREKQIEQEIEFYQSVNWKKTNSIEVTKLTRENKIDKLELILTIHENS